MQRQWYFLYHSKTNAFWMCDTDVARIGDLRCRQCNAITEDNGLLFFGPCTSHRQHHLEYSLRNHKGAVGVRLTDKDQPRRARARVTISGSVFIKLTEVVRRPAVGCIGLLDGSRRMFSDTA